MPNKELAARVGLAPSSALERVRRLVSGGVLRGFQPTSIRAGWGSGSRRSSPSG